MYLEIFLPLSKSLQEICRNLDFGSWPDQMGKFLHLRKFDFCFYLNFSILRLMHIVIWNESGSSKNNFIEIWKLTIFNFCIEKGQEILKKLMGSITTCRNWTDFIKGFGICFEIFQILTKSYDKFIKTWILAVGPIKFENSYISRNLIFVITGISEYIFWCTWH